MERSSMTKKSPVPAAVTFVGGLVTLIAVFLPWVKEAFGKVPEALGVANPGARSHNGLNVGGDGKIVLVIAIVLLLTGAGIALMTSRGAIRALGIVAIVVGVAAALIVVGNVATKNRQIDDAFGQKLTDQQRTILKSLGYTLDYGIGLYLAGVGGLIGAVGGAMAVASRAGAPPAPAPPAPEVAVPAIAETVHEAPAETPTTVMPEPPAEPEPAPGAPAEVPTEVSAPPPEGPSESPSGP